jgi:twitching motility protein PilJ
MSFNFLSQMRLWQKFALLGLVALALIAYPLYTVIRLGNETIATVRTEEAGLPPIRTVNQLTLALQDHRTAASHFVLNDTARAAPRAKAAADADAAFVSLESQIGTVDNPVMLQRLGALKKDWVALKAEVESRKLSSRQVAETHTLLINRSIAFVEDLTAHYLIDLDPEAGAYYAFRATLIELPQLAESIRGLRSPVVERLEEIAKVRKLAEQGTPGFNLDASLRDAMRPEDRARILKWVQQGERAFQNYGDNMRKGMDVSPDMRAEMGDQVDQITRLSAQAMQFVRREILDKETPTVEASAYQREVSVSREAALNASAGADKLLTTVLARRADAARNTTLLAIGGEAVLFLIGLGLATLIVRNITGTVANLQDSVNRVRAGDTTALLAIESKDEVGDLGRTVNDLLQERMAAQQKAEAENDGLNNSVVSLLGTMFELSQRNLSVRAEVTTDVVGTVADSVNMFADATATALGNVSTVANQVAESAGRVNANSQTLSQQSLQDRQEVLEMTQEIGQASALMQQVATLAEQSNQAAGQATATTLAALRSVNTTVGEMGGIRESIGEMEKRVKRLGERSQEISQIVTVINSISERTHVLALNASMQAAMAGEAGRGFAVVTEEVQRLADASRNATMQIAQLSQNIQLETSETVAALNRTVTDVVRGSEVAEKSGQQMQETEAANARLAEAVQRIANESTRQIALAVRLAQRAQAITQSNQQADRLMKNTNDDVAVLVQSSDRLIGVVSEFKLS